MSCYIEGALVDKAVCRLATQYRDSVKFKQFVAVFIEELELAQKALCESMDLDLDRLGSLLNFPRCWCNIKRKKWFGLTKPAKTYFGFPYATGETVVSPESCLGGYGQSEWKEIADPDDCADASDSGCCTFGDPTVVGFCEGELKCDSYPQHEDHCFDDDLEYAKLLNAKLTADNSTGTIDDVLKVAKILYGDSTTVYFDINGQVWLSLNRLLTDNEILLVDFYKRLIPVPIGVQLTIVTGTRLLFGFSGDPCLADRIGGFCEGEFVRSY